MAVYWTRVEGLEVRLHDSDHNTVNSFSFLLVYNSFKKADLFNIYRTVTKTSSFFVCRTRYSDTRQVINGFLFRI